MQVQGCAADISTDEGRKKLIDSVSAAFPPPLPPFPPSEHNYRDTNSIHTQYGLLGECESMAD